MDCRTVFLADRLLIGLNRCGCLEKERSEGMETQSKVTISYRNGKEETCYVTDYGIKSGCLSLYERYKGTRYIPIDTIKEWKVSD